MSVTRQSVDEDSLVVSGNKATFSCAPGATAIGAGYTLAAPNALLGSDVGNDSTKWVLTFQDSAAGITGTVLCTEVA
jgi:hypothetical protein